MIQLEDTNGKEAKTNGEVDQAKIDALIANLASHDGLVRQQARIALVEIGEPAVDALIEALDNNQDYMHWEAAKALSQIVSPKSAQVLLRTLEAEDFGIRWLAAEGLIAMAEKSIVPLLQALRNQPDSVLLREGAHHVLFDLIGQGLIDPPLITHVAPVLAALNSIEPAVIVPVAAYRALQALKRDPVFYNQISNLPNRKQYPFSVSTQ